jgi:hypothetical protein
MKIRVEDSCELAGGPHRPPTPRHQFLCPGHLREIGAFNQVPWESCLSAPWTTDALSFPQIPLLWFGSGVAPKCLCVGSLDPREGVLEVVEPVGDKWS